MAKKTKKNKNPGTVPESLHTGSIAGDTAAVADGSESRTDSDAAGNESRAVSDADDTSAGATLKDQEAQAQEQWFASPDAGARSYWESSSSVGDEILSEQALEDWFPSESEKGYIRRSFGEHARVFTHADSLHEENLHQEFPLPHRQALPGVGDRHAGTWQKSDQAGTLPSRSLSSTEAVKEGPAEPGKKDSRIGRAPASAAEAAAKVLRPALRTAAKVLRPVTEPVRKVLGPVAAAVGKKLAPVLGKASAMFTPLQELLGKAASKLNLPIRILRGILIGLALLLVLFIGVFHYEYSRLQKDTSDQFTDELVEEHVAQDMRSEELRKSEADMEAKLADVQEMDVVRASGEIFRNDSVYNILLLGTDDRTKTFSNDARSDTCILLSINQATGKVSLVSFERGMGMPILWGPYEGQYDWLTHMFRYGGAEMMVSEIRENFLVDVDRYIRVNIWTLIQLIDSIGGVDVEVTEEEAEHINHPEGTYTADYAKGMHVEDQIQELTPGMNHLNGATAMVYARTRYIDSDWRRVERQRNVIMAAARGLSRLNPASMIAALDAVVPLVQTDLSATEVANLLTLAPVFMGASIQQLTIPAQGTYGNMRGMNGRSLYAVNFEENAAILRDVLYASGDEEKAQDGNEETSESADGGEDSESGMSETEATAHQESGEGEAGSDAGNNSGTYPGNSSAGQSGTGKTMNNSAGSSKYSGTGSAGSYNNRSGNASAGAGTTTSGRTGSANTATTGTSSGQGSQTLPNTPTMTIVQNDRGLYVDQATGTPIDPNLVLTGPDGELVLDPSVAGSAVLNVQGSAPSAQSTAGQQTTGSQGAPAQGAMSVQAPGVSGAGTAQGQTTQPVPPDTALSQQQIDEELARQAIEQYEAQLAAQEAAAAAAAQAQAQEAAAAAAQQAAQEAAAQAAAQQAALEAELARQAAEQYAAQLAAQEAAAAAAAAQAGTAP